MNIIDNKTSSKYDISHNAILILLTIALEWYWWINIKMETNIKCSSKIVYKHVCALMCTDMLSVKQVGMAIY